MSEEVKEGGAMGNSLVAVLIAVLLAGGGGTYYFYNQYQKTQAELVQAKAMAAEVPTQANVQELVGKVGALMELPADETPTVAAIKDAEKLKDHPFLSKGQSGDQLLIYTGAKLVVMYRPGTNKIVAVGTVTIQQQEGTPAPAASVQPQPTTQPGQ